MGTQDHNKIERFTPRQLEELAGEYKTTDNPVPDDFSEEMAEATKRRSRPEHGSDQ